MRSRPSSVSDAPITSGAARRPLCSAPATVPDSPSVSDASPPKNRVCRKGAASSVRAAAPPTHDSLREALRGALLALRDEDTALARVPEVSRRLRERASAQAVIEALLAASRQGELELRPEGGIGRLTDEDAALCPQGAAGVRLSWVRLQEG